MYVNRAFCRAGMVSYIFESGVSIGKAVWRSVEEIKSEGSKLYPTGLEEIISGD
jgi:hypothetical protein